MSALLEEESSAGRKRRRDVWSHFFYIKTEEKTRCIVPDEYGVPCGHKMGGKNTTNLKRHLRLKHPEVSAQIPETVYRPQKLCSETVKEQSRIPSMLTSRLQYHLGENEQQTKERALALWIGRSGLPVRTVEDRDFIKLMEVVDRKLTLPSKTRIINLVEGIYRDERKKFKERLATARRITIGLDIWTTKRVNFSFLAVSACFFCTVKNQPEHILLSVKQISHPYTNRSVKACVDNCTEMWGIPENKIITVITDNGSNMAAAFKTPEEEGHSSSDESEDDESSDGDWEDEDEARYGGIERIPCCLHMLQLVVNMIHKDDSASRLLQKVNAVVQQFRKSPSAMVKLRQLCGLTLINDSKTRWSGTFQMISRLLQVKDSVAQVADEMGWDCFLPSEWIKMTAIQELLLPFAEHTKTLHSDTMSLSMAVPALLDLMAHLSQFSLQSPHSDLCRLADRMKADLQERFSCFLHPSAAKFSPLAATACLLDPTVAGDALIENTDDGIQELLAEAEKFILSAVTPASLKKEDECEDGDESVREDVPPSKKRLFRFLSTKSASSKLSKQPNICVAQQDLKKYKEELLCPGSCHFERGIDFWLEQQNSAYVTLKPLALDLLAMPASQAFVKQVFSITDLKKASHNKARVIFERSAFLKLNQDK
ncbi:uncharacterized protein LOC121527366 [Cheilinus undulatus]|uniref:uncharacterized protein LOC121527366 n=1 Tax=Cheilinus undulatus TaxID=241271 RepID=UPI001BD658EB|nr:uncharacterized protein LOC121527366 [Cheilinus undulatus]